MFAVKSRLLAIGAAGEFGDKALIFTPLLISGIVVVLAAAGSFGFLLVTMQDAEIRSAFFKTYDVFPKEVGISGAGRYEVAGYQAGLANDVHLAKIWFYMTFHDGFPLFIGTAILLRSQMESVRNKTQLQSIIIGFIISIVAVIAYALLIYCDKLQFLIQSGDYVGFGAAVVKYIINEMESTYDFVLMLFGKSKYHDFGDWYH